MKWLNSTERYGLGPIVFHWLILFLFLAVYASIELREVFPKGSEPREVLKTWHFMLGILIFLLLWPRLILLRQGHFPRINPEQPYWQKLLSRGMHLTLYGLMFLMPLTGWLLLSAEAKPIPFFGLQLPALISENKFVADLSKDAHELLGTLGYFLIALHTAAALLHHYFFRDNTLQRMLPDLRD
jgi:cytochrome b561